jgi:hypothetical protein
MEYANFTAGGPASVTENGNGSFGPPPGRQLRVSWWLNVTSGSLSLVGSVLLLVSLWRMKRAESEVASVRRSRRSTSPSHVYLRIMVAMSGYDILYAAFGCVFGTFLSPVNMDLSEGRGTRFSCSLGGFLVQLGFGSFAYGAWLNVYYLLTIRYNIREEVLVKYFEPVAHASVFLFYFGTALIAATIGLMNPTGGPNCWIAGFPVGCGYFEFYPCTRGARFREAVLLMIVIPAQVCVAIILTSLSLIVHAVWRQRAIALQQERSVIYSESQVMSRSSSTLDRLSKATVSQCIFSGVTFANSLGWTTAVYSITLAGKGARLGHDLYWVRQHKNAASALQGILPLDSGRFENLK